MRRESAKHNPREDDELKHELRGTLQGNRPSRVEEWRDPEPPTTIRKRPSPVHHPSSPEVLRFGSWCRWRCFDACTATDASNRRPHTHTYTFCPGESR